MIYPKESTHKAQVDSNDYESELLGENDLGSVHIHGMYDSVIIQMLNDPAMSKSPAMFKHISGVINDETKRLRFQVEKVLQMSMFERQKATLKMKDLNANDVDAACMMFIGSAKSMGLEVV